MADLPLLQSGRVENVGIPGAVLPSVQAPQVQYVGLQAAANYQSTIAQSLDRLSGTLFGIAKGAAQEAGFQYVADNPITDEQLRAAKDGNPAPLQLGGKFNIYDQAVRKARAFEVSSNFEAEARNELTVMLTAVEQGMATTSQVQNKIATMMDGYSKSLAGVDPEASLKFRATIATMGNTVLAKAAETEIKRQKQAQIIKFDRDFDNSTRLLEAAVSRGYWLDTKNTQTYYESDGTKSVSPAVRSVDDLADVFRQTINTSALLIGDANLQKSYSDKFEAALKTAKVNAVSAFVTSKEFTPDFSQGLGMLQTGEVGKMKDVFAGMPNDEKAKVVANYMVAFNNRKAVQDAQRAEDKRLAVAEFLPLYDKALALPEGNAQRKTLISQIVGIAERQPDAVPLGVLKDLLEPNKEGNPIAEFNTLRGIYEGTITSPDQIFNNSTLSGKQKVSALKLLTSEDRRDQRDIDTGLARLAGIPTSPGSVTVIDPKGKEFERLQQLRANALQIQSQAIRDGKVLQPRQILEQVSKDLEARRNTEQAKAAQRSLTEVWEKKPWINGPITRDSLPALERKAGDDKNKQREITQIKRLLEQAEGNQ